MPYWKISAWTIITGIAAMLILGTLPSLEQPGQQLRAKTAISVPQLMLSDDSLVDAMGGLRLQERLTRVEWDHSILTADLTLREDNGRMQGLVRDLAALVRFSFGDAANVRQLLIRVYRESGGKRTLLLYGDGRRENWTEGELASMQPPDSLLDEQFSRKLLLVKTAAGERWLRNLAN